MKTPIQELIEKVEHAIAYNIEGANVKEYTWEDLHSDMYYLLVAEEEMIKYSYWEGGQDVPCTDFTVNDWYNKTFK